MKYDLEDIQAEIRAVSALASGLGSQCEEGGNALTSETLTLAILEISSHLDRVAENLEQIESDYYARRKNEKEAKEDDNQNSLGEIKKIIEQTRNIVPEEFDLPGLDLVNAKEISRDVLEGVAFTPHPEVVKRKCEVKNAFITSSCEVNRIRVK